MSIIVALPIYNASSCAMASLLQPPTHRMTINSVILWFGTFLKISRSVLPTSASSFPVPESFRTRSGSFIIMGQAPVGKMNSSLIPIIGHYRFIPENLLVDVEDEALKPL